MRRSRQQLFSQVFENAEIIDAGAEGNAIARIGNMVIFVPFVVPGDIVDLQVVRKKKSFLEGRAIKFHKYSVKRAEPFCSHFGTCGGCRWQNLKYEDQLLYKHKQVVDAFERIAKIPGVNILPVLPSEKTTYYRNKLEYTFSNHRWLNADDMRSDHSLTDTNALGFHIPRLFDKILDIDHCYLQQDPSNAIRLEAKRYAVEHHLSFYDVRTWQGLMRNLIIRNSNTGGLMAIFVFRDNEQDLIGPMLDHFILKFPEITSLFYVINPKKNDVINDLPVHLHSGEPFITEKMMDFNWSRELEFRIGPVSFYQTNSGQALNLYRIAAEFAGFTGNENVYDLYTGTGTIASYIAGSVKKVTGIETVPGAIKDAEENTGLNGIENITFVTGEVEKTLTDDFMLTHGKPDLIITDPPRSGMHPKVIDALLKSSPGKIVYISCNPSTQARDIALMSGQYQLEKCQPVDMFPHTQHLENVVLLTERLP